MIDTAIYWLGAATAAAGGVFLWAALATWALDRALKFFGFAKIILHWYADKLKRERAAKSL